MRNDQPFSPAHIVFSPELTIRLGPGPSPAPADPVVLTVSPATGSWTLEISDRVSEFEPAAGGVVVLADREALERIGGAALCEAEGRYHLTGELAAIVLALISPAAPSDVRAIYQFAKTIEFICEAIRAFRGGELPATSGGRLSAADTRRVIAARELIGERGREKLTLGEIARNCGLNRSKLSRGFKALFDCTVAEAIAEQRLEYARRRLLTTDLPVASVGYEAGYLNNAAFARAFGRRYGAPPSACRAGMLAS
ncbi:MAG TPA: AraC family transcriptional regulator [Caulobacteraceae bacterium]|nr:AraC family transcriptional regulator [Caulobacteraceae bacterium]